MDHRIVIVVLLIIACAAEISAASTAEMEHRSAVESRRRPFGLGSLLYGPALGWLLAIKLKVVLVAIAVAVAMARGSKFWGPGSWGCATSYESPGPWVEEYPGPVKAYQERSDNFESESLTSRVMSGIELAKVGWKAVTESDEQNESCRARLTCEARQIAKESPPLAKMLDVFGASLREYDTGATTDCEQLGCSSLSSGVHKDEARTDFPTSVSPTILSNERPRGYYAW
ncbi:uncharacterized protein LOC135943233 [Cloeon dipterum]|uniref:uncharacterized protein LOC135943233 n=1 Tax=Cloeon dipterum TaxID=197152 RepID=UPI00321FECD4